MMEESKFDLKNFLTAFLLCMLIMMAWRMWQGQQPTQPTPQPTMQAEESAPTGNNDDTVTATGTWQLRHVTAGTEPIVLGSRDKDNPFKAAVQLLPDGAAVGEVLLSEYKLLVEDEQTGYPLLAPHHDKEGHLLASFACGELKIKGRPETFDLSAGCWHFDGRTEREDGKTEASFTATITDEQGRPQVELVKRFAYGPDNYQLDYSLSVVNHSDQELEITLTHNGPGGLRLEDSRSDRRQTIGCFVKDNNQPTIEHTRLRGKKDKMVLEMKAPERQSLLWFALENKFFAAVMRPTPNETAVGVIREDSIQTQLYPISIQQQKEDPATVKFNSYLLTRMTLAPEKSLAEGQTVTFPFQIYLGPIDTELFEKRPAYAGLHFEQLLNTYACMCTFDWLRIGLLKLMDGIYWLVRNYGIAIIVLVLVVRLVLHPVTKKGQVSMMQMTKQMSKIQPKMDEIRKKYAGNNMEMQRQMSQLYKEYNINPAAGCLGIVPMFIQMPIWVALFSAVDSNVHIRHQGLLPANWHWITDLSAPDRLIPFSWFGLDMPFHIPFLSNMIGGVDALNLLPILLCVAMFLQMKYTTQPTAAPASPQAAQQQKIFKFLMPAMMFLFFYTAPSGLNLYIMGSTFGGLIESHYIRKHIKEAEAREAEVTVQTPSKIGAKLGPKKKKPKPPIRFN